MKSIIIASVALAVVFHLPGGTVTVGTIKTGMTKIVVGPTTISVKPR